MSGSGLRDLTRNRKVDVALHNEALTRERVQHLERKTQALMTLYTGLDARIPSPQPPGVRGFWGRLRWLVTGR